PGGHVASQVHDGNLEHRHGSINGHCGEFLRGRCQSYGLESERVLRIGCRLECTVAAKGLHQRSQRPVCFRECFDLDTKHACPGFTVWGRYHGFIEGNLSELPCLVTPADRKSLPRGTQLEQRQ